MKFSNMPGNNYVSNFSASLQRGYPYILLLVYGAFMCGYFFFDDFSDHYRFFTRFVFLISLFVLLSSFKGIRHHAVFQALLAYTFFLLLSGLWSDPMDWYRFGQKTVLSIYLLSFIAMTYYLVSWNSKLFERTLKICVLIAAVAAVVNLVVYYREHSFPMARLQGVGSLTNINEFSNLYGVFALLAMTYALRKGALWARALFLLLVCIFVGFAWFGQSRTAFVSMLLALFVMMVLTANEKRWLYLVSLGVLVGVLVAYFPGLVERAIVRGEGLRPLIWAGLWPEIKSAFLFGNGLAATPYVKVAGIDFYTAHNAYIQVLWQGGVIALGLFLLLLGLAFRHAWRLGRQRQEYTVFCMLLFAATTMMTGVDTLIERPRDQWMLFWFPLALLISYQCPPSQAADPRPADS